MPTEYQGETLCQVYNHPPSHAAAVAVQFVWHAFLRRIVCRGMESPISTREFRIDDYEAAVRLWRVVEGVEIAEGDDKADVASFLKRNPGWSRVAIIDGKIVAVVLCGHDGRRGHIYHLAVDPAYRRRGLGKLLVEECLSGLRAAGIQRAIILVAGDNEYGLSFWRRAGWEEIDGAVVMGVDL